MLSDLQLSLGKQSVTSLDYGKLQVRRGKLVKDGLPEIKSPEYFKRYDLEAEGSISMRVLPGTPNGISLGTGLEHDEVGRPSENRAMRTAQSDKRLRKVRSVVDTFESPLYEDAPYPQSDLLIIGMAGTRAVISEVAEELREKGAARQSCPDSPVIAIPGLRSQPLSAGSEKKSSSSSTMPRHSWHG